MQLNKALNEIRLLRLCPASLYSNLVKCHLMIASLDASPHYEAISYVWGAAISEQTVEVDGKDVTVTVNLDSLLRHMRLADKERFLWVDALCINQSNIEERNHQVSRMRHIYEKASQVVVWLGEAWEGTELALEFLRTLGSNAKLHLDPGLEPCISIDQMNLDFQELRDHIIRLFTLPWWTRTWTVQEFVLAKQLVFQCSQNFVTQEEMFRAVDNFWYHKDQCCKMEVLGRPHAEFGESISTVFQIPAKLDFVTKHRGRAYSVLTAIAAFGDREVTDPRDKVYGMLGLGTGPYADLVEPDYSLTSEQVAQALLIKSIEQTKTLECFSHLFEHKNSKLPSFVPNWTEGVNSKFRLPWLGALHHFSASLMLPAQAQIDGGNNLVISGVLVDTIKFVSPSTGRLAWNKKKIWQKLVEFAGIGAEEETVYQPTGESRLSSLWQTVNVGLERWFEGKYRLHRRIQRPIELSKYEKWKAFCTSASSERADLWFTEISHICGDLKTGSYGRRFGVTEKGCFAMVQQRCKPGDVIAVLLGGCVPYVLRPAKSDSSRKCYQILGDAYVHGIMDGEVLQPEDTIERRLQKIVLV